MELDALLLSRLQIAANISSQVLFPMIAIGLSLLLVYFRGRFTLTGDHAREIYGNAPGALTVGVTAIYEDSPLQRCLRDVHVTTQHIMVADPVFEVAGRCLGANGR